MTDLSLTPAAQPATTAAGRTVLMRTLIALQLYVVAAYVSAAVIPYLWRDNAAPPTWVWIVPGWLLGVPGFWITLLGAVLAVPLALLGAGATALRYRTLSARLRWWSVSAAVLTTAYAVFTLTPPAATIAAWVAD
ncbi:hypothetical protein [Actinoplanes sp. M2I2]|uniref:hypothetical protein n=1 Tax=Actinoplanes sp. M2I2 TaxID=1734444 RepID=UPI002021E050|nr:hypothetical protein [Actinoplanes sp. M2I2]